MRTNQDYTQAILHDLDNVDAYFNRGSAYYGLEQFERAIKDFGDAITLRPENETAYAGRALALTQLGRDEEAQQDLERAVELGIDRATLTGMVEGLRSER